MATTRLLAFDLGAASGRATVGSVGDDGISLAEVARFPNGPVAIGDRLYWDAPGLFLHIQEAITTACHDGGPKPAAIGVSTWGIDFSLLDEGGELVGLPYCYRDTQTTGMMEEVFSVVPKADVFALTGIQFMPINSLYHLVGISRRAPKRLQQAKTLLFTPDLFNYWLSGVARNELTIASTSQAYRGDVREWATEMLDKLGVPATIFPQSVEPGTRLGPVEAGVAERTGADGVEVIAVAGHDTASAMAAVPYESGSGVAISCGTWSSVGIELEEQCRTAHALERNFTNEIGIGGKFLFRKNMTGLWLLQECRRVWATEGADYGYPELAHMAEKEPGFGTVIEPDYIGFQQPGKMPQHIAEHCKETGQTAPRGVGTTVRVILESMALKYRLLVDQIDEMLGRTTKTIHLVGGGSKNAVLCQFTANATGRKVIAGPDEATTLGNIMVQSVGIGLLPSFEAGRALIARTAKPVTYTPTDEARWNTHYDRFTSMRKSVQTAF